MREREPNVEREAPAPPSQDREAVKNAREHRGERETERAIPDRSRYERRDHERT